MFRGDRVCRVDGTAVGFRRHEYFEVVDASRTHIKVKNGNGLISKWFERSDFMWISDGLMRRKEVWSFVYKDNNGRVYFTSENDRRAASEKLNYIQAQPGYVILAKKKITIPYEERA